jgi:hypothetical protein
MSFFGKIAPFVHSVLCQVLLIFLGMCYHIMAGAASQLPWVINQVFNAAAYLEEWCEYVGWWEVASLCYLLVCVFLIYQTYGWVIRKWLWMASRKGIYPDDFVTNLRKFEFVGLDDKGIRREGACAAGKLLTKVKDAPKFVVKVYITLEKDTLLKSAEPVFMGFATRCGDLYVLSYHEIEYAYTNGFKVFVAKPGSEDCVEVDIDVEMTNEFQSFDIAFLNPRRSFTLLGVKNPNWDIFTPGMGTQVYTYDVFNNSYHMTFDNAVWEADRDDILLFFTHSNTHAADSGLPVIQNGRCVGVHIGHQQAKNRNVHCAVPFLVGDKWEATAKQFKRFDKGIEFSSPIDSLVNPAEDNGKTESITRESPDIGQFRTKQAEFAEVSQKRMRGEDVDDQGFRNKRRSDKPELNESDLRPLKGKRNARAWGDEEFEITLENAEMPALVKPVNHQATLQGAIEILQGRISRTSSVSSLSDTTSPVEPQVVAKANIQLPKSTPVPTSQESQESPLQSKSSKKKKTALQKLRADVKRLNELLETSSKPSTESKLPIQGLKPN